MLVDRTGDWRIGLETDGWDRMQGKKDRKPGGRTREQVGRTGEKWVGQDDGG